jgi:hypothetical protein
MRIYSSQRGFSTVVIIVLLCVVALAGILATNLWSRNNLNTANNQTQSITPNNQLVKGESTKDYNYIEPVKDAQGCYYQEVSCFAPPCDPIRVCPSETDKKTDTGEQPKTSLPTEQPKSVPTVEPEKTPSSEAPQSCSELSTRIQVSFRSACGDKNYDSAADVTKDGVINTLDVSQVRQNYMSADWCKSRLADTRDICRQPQPSSSPTSSDQCQQLNIRVTNAFSSACGDSRYDGVADLNRDRNVNTLDISELRRNYSDNSWCEARLTDTTDPCTNHSTESVSGGEGVNSNQNVVVQVWSNIQTLFHSLFKW